MKRLSFAVLGLLLAGTAAAQTTGYGPLALKLPASARMGGMGDVGVGGRDDDVIFYNPAQLFVARGTSFSLARLTESTRGGTMSTVLRLGPGAVGFGVNYLEYQAPILVYPLDRRDVLDGNITRGTSALGALGYSQVLKGFRLGASAKYAMDAIDLQRFSQIYADLGVAREIGRYTVALAIQNLGQSLSRGTEKIEAPAIATLGGAHSRALGPLDVAATAAVSYSLEDDVTAGGGAEVGWSWISGYSIAGRAGIHQARRGGGDTELTAGFGFTADRTTLDVAAERLPGSRIGYRAGIRIR